MSTVTPGPVAGGRGAPTDWAAPDSPSGAAPGPAPEVLGGVPVGAPGGADPWAAGILGADAGVAVARADATGPTDRAGGRLDGPGPLAELTTTGPGGVLDGAFELLRFRFGRLVAVTAAVLLPLQVLRLVLTLTVARGVVEAEASDPFAGLGVLGGSGSASTGWGILLLVVQAVALCVVGIGVGSLVVAWVDGRDPTTGATLAVMARRTWVAVVLTLVTALVKLPLACLGGLGFFLGDALFFAAGVIAGAERLGPFATVARSVRLTRPAYGLALVVCFGGFVITYVLQLVLTVGPVALIASLGPPEGWIIAVQQAASLVLLVTVPLTACIAARWYLELRCRVEGLDLVRRQESRGLG